MNEIIFDASYLIALIDENDKWHTQAEEIMEEILISGRDKKNKR
jgi:predicted nucleic acid-binding protein